jgi:hypothetical protein
MLFDYTISEVEYNDLWNRHFMILGHRMPTYRQFKFREDCFRDYLLRIIWGGYKIKYILIAEGPPGSDNYIYADAKGSYTAAPINAFFGRTVTTHLDADLKLELLALKRILVLDLFPFAINLSPKDRKKLVAQRVPLDFFKNNANPYSIYSRLKKIRSLYPKIMDLSVSPNTAFIAPPTISKYLGGLANNGTICNGNDGLQIRGRDRKYRNKKLDYCVANEVRNPNSKLIRKALVLP